MTFRVNFARIDNVHVNILTKPGKNVNNFYREIIDSRIKYSVRDAVMSLAEMLRQTMKFGNVSFSYRSDSLQYFLPENVF